MGWFLVVGVFCGFWIGWATVILLTAGKRADDQVEGLHGRGCV
jgi:hypothetical protein